MWGVHYPGVEATGRLLGMAFFNIFRVCTLAGVVLVGCGDKSPGDEGTGTGSASSSGGVSMSETGEPTTGEASTSAGSDSESATGTSGGSTTGEASTGVGTGTTGEAVCSIEHEACELAGSLGEFTDCGVVNPWDDAVELWQAAHDCALGAATAQKPFKLITILQGIDSDVAEAYVGVAARSYALSRFFFDGDPCGGGGCGPVVSAGSCAGLVATMDCVVEPGTVCLSCEGAGTSEQVCGPA